MKRLTLIILVLLCVVTVKLYAQNKMIVKYVAEIQHDEHGSGFDCSYYIFMTDEHGTAVAPIQSFIFGIWSYIFKELVQIPYRVTTRVAQMVKIPGVICPESYTMSPCIVSGIFYEGCSYIFPLFPDQPPGTGNE
jgi:hypothetical protein